MISIGFPVVEMRHSPRLSYLNKGKFWFQQDDIVTSSPPSAAYMCQWIGSALVQIMACRLFSAKPLSKPMMGYCQLNSQEQTLVKFQSKHENIFENILCEKAAILCRGRWVNLNEDVLWYILGCRYYGIGWGFISHSVPSHWPHQWFLINRNHQQYSQYLVVESGTINLFPGQGADQFSDNGKLRKVEM